MKSSLQTVTTLLFVMLLGTVSGDVVSKSAQHRNSIFSVVSAEDDEEDEEDEDREEADDAASSSVAAETQQIIQSVTEYKPVTKTVIVTDEEYRKDSDEDLLVDAIDPNPLVKQSEYFTDIDGDGVPNVFDAHHDEDDFAYFDDAETDKNGNGILDSYEE
ncbi:MAG: hypothetical protein PHT88_01195 [Candidatus Moranbacteria bacterium]|nr:hypothetical protein [Candidatus Moranbacteria bacterium]